jgi:hypothetical protein
MRIWVGSGDHDKIIGQHEAVMDAKSAEPAKWAILSQLKIRSAYLSLGSTNPKRYFPRLQNDIQGGFSIEGDEIVYSNQPTDSFAESFDVIVMTSPSILKLNSDARTFGFPAGKRESCRLRPAPGKRKQII